MSSPLNDPQIPSLPGADIERLRSLSCIKWQRYDGDVIPAWVADMDLAPAPVTIDAVSALAACGDFGYNMAAASELPDVWAAWEQRNHGWLPDTRRVRLWCDVMQAVETVVWTHIEPGDGVVIFTPCYHPFFPAIEAAGGRVVSVPLTAGEWRLDPEVLEAAVDATTRAILMCNPHNPTGRIFDRDELEAIAAVAERHDLLVISDEIWCDLTHPSKTHIPFESLSDEAAARTVTISAASKAFNIAGLRTAISHVHHKGVREKLNALPRHILGGPSTPGAVATHAAWTQGEPWLGSVRIHLTDQRDHIATRLAAELPEVGFTLPEATYLAWLDFRPLGLGDEPAEHILERGRVALSRGLDFGQAGAGWARLNFATSREILDEILDRIIGAVHP